MIYFDNAATTGKKPIQIINAVSRCLENMSANPGRSGHRLSQQAAMLLYKTREKTAEFFGADGPENVVFTGNCTESLNFVIKGATRSGSHIIISDLEHNAVWRPLNASGLNYDIAEVSLTNDADTVENFRRLIRKDTSMIICTGASNVIGKKLPLEMIGNLCSEYGLRFTVDAAQIAGILPVDMKKMNIDYLCVAPHKGLYAPMGLGILIAKKPIEKTIIEGGTGTDSISQKQPEMLPERLESGTVNLPAVAGLSAGIDFVKAKGISRVINHETSIISRLYNALSEMKNIKLYTPPISEAMYAPVLSFNVGNMPSNEVATILDKNGIFVRAGLHCAPLAHKKIGTLDTGTVRVCPSVFNTKNEVDFLIRVLKNIDDKNYYKKLQFGIE